MSRQTKLVFFAIIVVAAAGGWYYYNNYFSGGSSAYKYQEQPSVQDMLLADAGAAAQDGSMLTQKDLSSLNGSAPGAAIQVPPTDGQTGLVKPDQKVVFAPKTQRDPTVSPAEEGRLQIEIAAREREEKRLREEAEKKRLKELEDLRKKEWEEEQRRLHPEREIINKLRIQGTINREVFINDKVYTVGDTVLGARITAIGDGVVTFSYKGKTFTKKMPNM